MVATPTTLSSSELRLVTPSSSLLLTRTATKFAMTTENKRTNNPERLVNPEKLVNPERLVDPENKKTPEDLRTKLPNRQRRLML